MRALLVAPAALLCGPAWAQDTAPPDSGAVCRRFCDAGAAATRCRKDAAFEANVEADPLVDLRTPRPFEDDFTAGKRDAANRSAEKSR